MQDKSFFLQFSSANHQVLTRMAMMEQLFKQA